MKQITDDYLCKYCFGCEMLENPNFVGMRRCSAFYPTSRDWYSKYLQSIQKKRG